jgi:hypothetical protein
LYLEFQDAIYRQDTEGGHLYRTFESLRGSIAREDQALAGHLASQLSGYLTDNSTVVYCPMAIGGHVDHVLARNCGRILKAHNTCVVYYRDFFYDQTWSGAVEDDEIAPAPLNVRLTNQELSKKVAAFSEYKSQISDLFNSKTGLASYFAGTGSNEAIFLPRQTSPAHLAMLFSVLK